MFGIKDKKAQISAKQVNADADAFEEKIGVDYVEGA